MKGSITKTINLEVTVDEARWLLTYLHEQRVSLESLKAYGQAVKPPNETPRDEEMREAYFVSLDALLTEALT